MTVPFWGFLLIGLIVLCIFIVLMDSNRFVIREYTLESDQLDKDVQFVFLSDLHNKSFGKDNKKLLRAIEDCKPQFIVCGGDMPTANPGAGLDVSVRFMQNIAAKYRIYYANGNHEYRMRIYPEKYGDMHERYDAALKACGIKRLINETGEFDDRILIHGLELERKYYRRFHKESPTEEVIRDSFGEPLGGDGKYHILLAHNPEYFDVYAGTGVDLVLAGHVHGGVARLPFLGGVISPSLRFFPKYDGGLFQKGSCRMILSRGLGMHTIPVRFLNPAELVKITIRKKRTDIR